jgi:hypothetical protein
MKSYSLMRASWALRKVKTHLPRLRSRPEPKIDVEGVQTKLKEMHARVTAETVRASGPVLDAYVDTHVADWLALMKTHHNTVTAELDKLAVEVAELTELYRIHLEDQEDVLNDLDGAVTHALERLSEPDSPFYEPGTRNERKGDNE